MAHRPSLFLFRILGARFPFFFYPLSRSVKDLFSRRSRSFVDNFSLFFFPRENLKIVGRTRDGEKWGVERRERVTAENRPHRRSLLDHDANHFPVLDKFVSFRLVIAFVLQQRHCSLASPPLLSRAFFFFQPDANNEIILRSKKNHPFATTPSGEKIESSHFAPEGSNVPSKREEEERVGVGKLQQR